MSASISGGGVGVVPDVAALIRATLAAEHDLAVARGVKAEVSLATSIDYGAKAMR